MLPTADRVGPHARPGAGRCSWRTCSSCGSAAGLLESLARAHFRRAQRLRPRRVRLRRRARPLRVPAGGVAHPAHLRRPEQAGHLQGPGLVVQRVRPQGVLHPARRGPARLPLAGRVPRDRRRPVPPPALAGHPRGGAGVLGGGHARLVEQAGRVAARDRDRRSASCCSGSTSATTPRPPDATRRRPPVHPHEHGSIDSDGRDRGAPDLRMDLHPRRPPSIAARGWRSSPTCTWATNGHAPRVATRSRRTRCGRRSRCWGGCWITSRSVD